MTVLFHPGDLSSSEWLILLGVLVIAFVVFAAFVASIVYIIKIWVKNK